MKWILMLHFIYCSYVLALCPPLSPEPIRVSLKQQQHTQEFELSFSDPDLGRQQLQLRLAQRNVPIATLDLPISNNASRFQASPLIEDANLDGFADHIWVLDSKGKLWRLSIGEGQFGSPKLMADLSDSGLDFIATAGLLRARLPTVLAPLAWRHADQQLVLLIARQPLTGHDTLLMLRFSAGMPSRTVINFSHLADRTLLSDAEQSQVLSAEDWRALLSKAGWQVQLPGKISTAPKVVAGVIYAAVASTAEPTDCVPAESTQQLYALHLHTASKVYASRHQTIPYLSEANLTLRQQPNKQLKLVLQNEQQLMVIQPNLLKISVECHNCTEPLSLDKFPLWKRLATYRSERGLN